MATRTIQSPGVEIRESDLTLIAPQNIGTNFFVTGFAQQGPIDEVLKITSKQELDQVFGVPTTSAERYFYHTISELLNSPGNVYASRIPYGENTGEGFGSKYSALAYPVTAVNEEGTAFANSLAISAGTYILGAPTHYELTESQYLSVLEGTAFEWSASGGVTFSSVADLGKAGVVILNKAQTTINGQYEGYYVGLLDNTNIDPASDYNGILDVKTVTNAVTSTSSYTKLPTGILQFTLSAESNGATNSISQVMENLTDYNIDGREDDDVLNIGVFKLRKSIYATETFKLDYVLEDAIVGSINSFRTQLNENGGPNIPFYLENRDERSRNVQIFINDNLSNRLSGGDALSADGTPRKKIRVHTSQLSGVDATVSGISSSVDLSTIDGFTKAESLFALGSYSDATTSSKVIGDIPSKLDRILEGVKNDEVYELDVVVEAGLGTIYAAASAAQTPYYDEFTYNSNLASKVNALRTSNDVTPSTLLNDYGTIFNKFQQFVEAPYLGGARGDCIFVADPIRHIFVTGADNKVLSDKNKNFQTHIYWPIRHQFENENTSYACVYGNWAKVYDSIIGQQVWVPFSGFAAAAMARTDAETFPWFAPAGFNRGLVRYANDIAVTPNQKQRDELYKANINPVTFFPSQGLVIYGQKTLSKKPSAFNRINVRRLFLALERPTKKASRFFVFEQNSEFTRTRLINVLTPIFERAKNNEGLYDYLIVCDERNNTPEVIDNNELVADIYIKPTRTAEFILVNFYATRTDANFQEIIG